jgi:hypothetical protein
MHSYDHFSSSSMNVRSNSSSLDAALLDCFVGHESKRSFVFLLSTNRFFSWLLVEVDGGGSGSEDEDEDEPQDGVELQDEDESGVEGGIANRSDSFPVARSTPSCANRSCSFAISGFVLAAFSARCCCEGGIFVGTFVGIFVGTFVARSNR